MPPWLNLLYRQWREINPEEDAGGMDLEDAEKSLLEVTAGREDLGDWITAQVEGRPYVVAFPGSGKKVNLVHNAWSNGSQLVSFLGFLGTAPLRSVDLSSLAGGLMADKMSVKTGELLVPSIRQFLATTSTNDLINNIVGEGPRTLASFKAEAGIC
jgi:hypothetical protein